MKTTNFYVTLLMVSLLAWSCNSKDDLGQGSLKTSLTANTQSLTTAMASISTSPAYQVLTSSETSGGASKVSASAESTSATTLDSISLTDITGIYEYNNTKKYKKWQPWLLNFFTKTADSAVMVVKLPEEKVKNARTLLTYSPADSLLTNNYIFSLSKYKYKFGFPVWSYDMASTINIKGVDAGALNIQSSVNSSREYQFTSGFAFASGYDVKCNYKFGDSLVSTYSISQASKVLYEEKFTAAKVIGSKRLTEREYALTIGDIKIVRKPGMNSLDSSKVYVAGVLQTKSKVEIVDQVTDSIETSVTNKKRELKITFDDGTSTTLSQLLGANTLETIRTLFVSMRQTYFATSIVDKIAWNVYQNKK